MKKRILIFSLAYEPYMAGAEIAVKEITDRLGNEFEFDLITCWFGEQKEKERVGNVNVHRVSSGSQLGKYLYVRRAYKLAVELQEKNNYQIAWGIMAAYAGAAAMFFVRKFPNVKYLLTLQEGDSIEHIHRRVFGFKKRWQEIFAEADYIQAISNFLADWANKEGATCPIDVVPNSVDLNRFKVAENLKEQDGIFKIITVSRLVPKNGVDILIEAGAELKKMLPNRKFIIQIAGIGPQESELKRRAKYLGISDRVKFMGNVDQKNLPEHLGKADVFVRPSRSEGLGTAFLEAMAVGTPIIGSYVGGIPDFLTPPIEAQFGHEVPTGLVVDLNAVDVAKKIKQIMEDRDLKEKLVVNARKLIEEKYDWDNIAPRMKIIFDKLS